MICGVEMSMSRVRLGFLYRTQAARDLWWSKLNEVRDCERSKEPRATNIQVLYYDCSTNIEYVSACQSRSSIGARESVGSPGFCLCCKEI
jgi:hypothetical protein